MNMMTMLGLVLLVYFCSLILICLYRDKINIKIGNLVFVILDVLFFFCWNYASYQKGWLDDRFMTLDNISPFVFTLIPFTYIMRDKVKSFAFSAIAFLSFGMFCAMLVSPEHAYLFSFNHEANFLYASEAVCHMLCSLFGFYLVLTGQVKVDVKHWLKSVAFMYCVITFGVFLNYVFHKDFFGMDPYGDYHIYMVDIFGTFGATLAAYYLGVFVVLTLGFQTGYLLEKFTGRHSKKHAMRLNNLPFISIKSGRKDLELRLNDKKRQAVKIGDIIEFTNTQTQEKITVEVVNKYAFENFVNVYKTFEKERLGYETSEKAHPSDMEQYYSKEEIQRYGVVAIQIKILL